MGKSLNRVKRALQDAGYDSHIVETGEAKTAEQAAQEVGCDTNQIGKSIILAGKTQGDLFLFITAGARMVDPDQAADLVGQPLVRADATVVRKITGFAIGGVSPIGHLTPITSFMDEVLFQFDQIYVAAGTPHHVFAMAPSALLTLSNATRATFSK